jgi:hypothetical protein
MSCERYEPATHQRCLNPAEDLGLCAMHLEAMGLTKRERTIVQRVRNGEMASEVISATQSLVSLGPKPDSEVSRKGSAYSRHKWDVFFSIVKKGGLVETCFGSVLASHYVLPEDHGKDETYPEYSARAEQRRETRDA